MRLLRAFYCVLISSVHLSHCLIHNSTALILGVDEVSTETAAYILNGYGLTFEEVQVSAQGANLPTLETSSGGNYGLFVIIAQVEVNGQSLLTPKEWQSLYDYQLTYGVRMIHLNVAPSEEFGTNSTGTCCDGQIEQNITIVETAQTEHFPSAGLRVATLSTIGLYHSAAAILDANASTTTSFVEFQPNEQFSDPTIAGVINQFQDGREQMAFFLEVGNWSLTSTYLGHAWVQWGYRGTYQGYRRVYLQTQVDDLFLPTALYSSNQIFRLRAEDLQEHVQWTYDLNTRLNKGSSYFTEFGFNSNGNTIFSYAQAANSTQLTCDKPVFTDWSEPPALEFIKPLGTGRSLWASRPDFTWTGECIFLDPLAIFFANITNRDSVGLVSHTFTHLQLDNATYHDALREISFNLAYAELLNFTRAAKFSGSGLIPPAITGLHNGDAIRAWADNGLWNAIGDNTRPVLRNYQNFHWPLMTTMEENGYDGYQITPRFATRIYYNCDDVDCDVRQWIETENGTENGTIFTLLDIERASVTNQLLALYHDPYMFHQPNLRQIDVAKITLNGSQQQLSLLQMWVETITTELMRLVTWPIITLKHDHIATAFSRRMMQDACQPFIQYWTTNSKSGFTVRSINNDTCDVPVPVTVSGELADTKGFVTEQFGTDPLTLWVKLDGEPISFEFTSD